MKKAKLKMSSLMLALILTNFTFGVREVVANSGGYATEWEECEGKNVAVKRCALGSGTCQVEDQYFCDEIITPQ